MDKRVAIEHTSIDFLPHQRRDDARFDEIFGLLEKEFRTRSEFSGCISISFGAMPSGVNWDAVREALRKWISREVPSLDNGTTEHHIDGVPFSIRVRKPSSISQLWFAREATDDSKFADRLLNLTFPVARYGVGLSFREVFGIEFCDTPQLAAGSFILVHKKGRS